jgi:hypothetical protein
MEQEGLFNKCVSAGDVRGALKEIYSEGRRWLFENPDVEVGSIELKFCPKRRGRFLRPCGMEEEMPFRKSVGGDARGTLREINSEGRGWLLESPDVEVGSIELKFCPKDKGEGKNPSRDEGFYGRVKIEYTCKLGFVYWLIVTKGSMGRFWGSSRNLLTRELYKMRKQYFKLVWSIKLIRNWYKAHLRKFGIKWRWKRKRIYCSRQSGVSESDNFIEALSLDGMSGWPKLPKLGIVKCLFRYADVNPTASSHNSCISNIG